jgi:hypothetical protein
VTAAATRRLRETTAWDPRVFERPLFWPIRAHAARLPDTQDGRLPDVAAIDAALAAAAGVRFTPAPPRVPRRRRAPASMYDTIITERGVVPTREGSWHDLMNALVWATFPRAKRALHALQRRYVAEDRARGDGRRSPAHDALALLDEGGVLAVFTGEPPTDLERSLDDGDARVVVFGHAIYESDAIGGPRPLVRARLLRVPRLSGDFDAIDQALAALLSRDELASTPQDLPRIAPSRIFGA